MSEEWEEDRDGGIEPINYADIITGKIGKGISTSAADPEYVGVSVKSSVASGGMTTVHISPEYRDRKEIDLDRFKELLDYRDKVKRISDEVTMNPNSEKALMKVYSVLATITEFNAFPPEKVEEIAQKIVDKLCQL